MESARDRELIEDELRRVVADQRLTLGPLVFACLQHAVFSGGKRLRPLLGLSIARTVRADTGACITAVAAVELLHCASLIVDDLPCMDNDMVRRSRRAAHAQFGEPIAILGAFALVLLGIRIAREQTARQTPSDDGFQNQVIDSLLRNGLIAGQEADITQSGAAVTFSRNMLKTAPLFELACAAGLVGVDVTPPVRSALLAFSRSYGHAFQAMDDLADGDSLDEADLKRALFDCRDHLDEIGKLGFDTRYLVPFVERLHPTSAAHDSRIV